MAIHKLNTYKITWKVIKPNLHLFIIEVINSPKIGSWGVKERVVESMIWRISAQLVQLKPLSNLGMIAIVFIALSCENGNKKTRTEKCTEYFGICKNDSKSFFVWCGLHVALVVSENYEIKSLWWLQRVEEAIKRLTTFMSEAPKIECLVNISSFLWFQGQNH